MVVVPPRFLALLAFLVLVPRPPVTVVVPPRPVRALLLTFGYLAFFGLLTVPWSAVLVVFPGTVIVVPWATFFAILIVVPPWASLALSIFIIVPSVVVPESTPVAIVPVVG